MNIAGEKPSFHWKQHIIAAVTSIFVVAFVFYDRRPPTEYISGEISPHVAKPGDSITVRWFTDWSRHCQAMISRELVGANSLVRAYEQKKIRVPTQFGTQTTEIPLLLPSGMPTGGASYKVVARFPACGLTSRIWPLVVESPVLFFQIENKPTDGIRQ